MHLSFSKLLFRYLWQAPEPWMPISAQGGDPRKLEIYPAGLNPRLHLHPQTVFYLGCAFLRHTSDCLHNLFLFFYIESAFDKFL